ncbi:hypothetical protein J3459_018614 [Metarhizium acridum]|nr:hypothetical protein J3459_018614 [Metarhizium acridum]
MRFDTTISQVTHWLQDIPINFQNTETSFQVKSHASSKRRKLSDSDPLCALKRRLLLSLPASLKQVEMDSMQGAVSTPKKRQAADDANRDTDDENDNDQTPRGDPRKEKLRGKSTGTSASSHTSSTYSRSSKRSRGSQSPIKMWPLEGPLGHKLMRANQFGHHVPAVQELIDQFDAVNRGRSIMPKSLYQSLRDVGVGRLYDDMFFEQDTAADRPCDKDLVRYAQRIAQHSNTCASQLQDEGAWNNLVHSRLLDLFVHDMQDGPDHGIIDFLPCLTTNMNLSYHRFSEPTSRVDYIIRILHESQDDDVGDHEPLQWFDSNRMPLLNWTTGQLLPIAFSIETKRYGGGVAKGEQQLGIWNAAQWEFLISKAGEKAVKELDFIPGVVVEGHTWSLVITTRHLNRTNVFPGIQFGNTHSIIGVFQVIAGLRILRTWAIETLWPWYKKYLPGIGQPSARDLVTGVGLNENRLI